MNEERDNTNGIPKGARFWFGIFMVIIYLAVGLMFMLNMFNIDNSTMSICVGIILAVYGIWRGIRLYKGWN